MGIEKMNALWKDMANIKLSDRGMIWMRLWSCRTAWSTLSRSSRGPRLERRAGELTPEKTSWTEWMNTTTPNPSPDKLLSLWKHIGGNTLSASQMETLARQIFSTEESLIIPWRRSASGFHQPSEVTRSQ